MDHKVERSAAPRLRSLRRSHGTCSGGDRSKQKGFVEFAAREDHLFSSSDNRSRELFIKQLINQSGWAYGSKMKTMQLLMHVGANAITRDRGQQKKQILYQSCLSLRSPWSGRAPVTALRSKGHDLVLTTVDRASDRW
ncbi:hypothetical protein [Bradyrhizobium sp. HKCCYLR20261]|uniref:hypothetical protein n=1 Tax=Bradyrhizobium sp. HKCCYLR20261 TaxID=3420760 RepID=UPI003EC073A3